MSDKVVVRFLKAWRGYSADELAGFDEAVADGLKTKGFAEAYEADGESQRKPAKSSRVAGSKPNSQKTGGRAGTSNTPSDSPETTTTTTTDAVVGEGTTDGVVDDEVDDEEKP
ncbi:hypothetical protein PS673_02921 [Pseudomonas fluorescens]|uniref:Uncharacterized protein n=1 Tax=Pseudomonas fluorescens TaxID=294 RepID=A0A5E6TJY0_PSEFL|nr:hypothetical protein [Pseudomonas fluorescens]VVM93679.1 hypothetical protein PS673_02921 [Pseudomonas fluorescens]